jgi:hypothetical protein
VNEPNNRTGAGSDEAVISDEALMAFVGWCRMNHWTYTNDPVLVRRVFDAYCEFSTDRTDGVNP